MRLLLFLLVLLPTVAPIRCYAGWNKDYLQVACSVLDIFCYKLDPNKDGYTEKGCGITVSCFRDGCSGGLCCCSGDYCNAAPGFTIFSSLLLVSAAAMACLGQ
ncbi:hypothetical protein PRIPAC_81971 [Pristionchus pacificus]|uniref:Uncharacterized protein n=1 Tax=Pristionchus pacificus TaxID=54126 RepID=A0A2A6BHB5_PRIPA|nr:hypothetical protein PRIPAC_81971 [Pristionchus pacificus]|eukprot:PDM65238.1 hypothetical protein PRIPAC_52180 [Pristionchus pacificus]